MNNRLKYLTISMISLLVFHPFLEGGLAKTIVLNVLISAVCVAGVFAVGSKRKNLIIASLVGLPWFVMTWVNMVAMPSSLIVVCIPAVFLTAFYLFTALLIFKFVLSSESVGQNALFGAVSVYLLVGGAFSMVYTVLEVLSPGSFYVDSAHNLDRVLNEFDFLYLSYTTLTTLGYGDITPVTSSARMLTVFEAIVGVLYLAVIVGRLVGIYISQSSVAISKRP